MENDKMKFDSPHAQRNAVMENDKSKADNTHILVVDDDSLLRESLEQNLVDAGFAVTGFSAGAAMLEYLAGGRSAELIILDWKMPHMNGIEVLKRLRETTSEIPVIFLTVLSDQIYEEAALLGGAVDFVEKSRSFSILLKRVELILEGTKKKRGEPQAPERNASVFKCGELELMLDSSRGLWKGQRVDLSLTEFKLVQYLASHAGKDVRYRELYDLVHGEGFVAGAGDEGYRANVRTFVKRIRQKFRDVDGAFDAIENYPGFGYRWRATDSAHA